MPLRRRPVARAAATAAVVGGAAHYGARRGQEAAMNQNQYQEAPPSAPQPDDKIVRLTELGKLRDSGVLSEAEFEVEKAKVLAGY